MLVGEKVIGVITIQDYETPEAYDNSHVELLSHDRFTCRHRGRERAPVC